MSWQVIDFQGIVTLSKTLVRHLRSHLERKETELSQTITNAIPEQTYSKDLPPLSLSKNKLSEGVENFALRAKAAFQGKPPLRPWSDVAKTLNRASWVYVEMLENTVVELFQQIDQVSLEDWRPELLGTVETIKELLAHEMENLQWALKRLESHLNDYRVECEKQEAKPTRWWSSFIPHKPSLDRGLTANIDKSHKFLIFNYQKFSQRYAQYEMLSSEIELVMEKFNKYTVLNSLESDQQEKFKKLYRLLKLWEKNQKIKALPQSEIITALRMSMSPSHAFQIFKDYFKALRQKLFDQSRLLKVEREASNTHSNLAEHLTSQRQELHTLGATIDKYRKFMLKTDPDPYVRASGGFSEWIVGHEPLESHAFLNQEYDIEMLDRLFLKMESTLKSKSEIQSLSKTFKSDVYDNLHDMGQPLASQNMMSIRSDRLVHQLESLHELSTTNQEIVDFVTSVLSKAMRADWKYNTLFEKPQFHDLYAIHIGIIGPNVDRHHLNRLNKFQALTQQVLKWVKTKKVVSHLHEIEVDINDIKGYLQDFLAQVQRIDQESFPEGFQETMRQTAVELMEYRYLFGKFFHALQKEDNDEKLMRQRFLFVDQYFESIEGRLMDLKTLSKEGL